MVLTACSASLKDLPLPPLGKAGRDQEGPTPRQTAPPRPRSRASRGTSAALPRNPVQPIGLSSTPACTGLPVVTMEHGSALLPFPVPPPLPGTEGPPSCAPSRAPRERGQSGHCPPTSGPLCWSHPGANAPSSRGTSGSHGTQASLNLHPAWQPSCPVT